MRRKKVIDLIRHGALLVASVLSLLSVVIPHHHHRDGMPCYASLQMEQQEGDHGADAHDCGCHGHNLGYMGSLANSGTADMHVLQVVSIYTFQLESPVVRSLNRGEAFYYESAYDPWITRARGLRAPPCLA